MKRAENSLDSKQVLTVIERYSHALDLCKGCVHPCKQSFRAVVLSCPHYLSLRSKKCGN